MNESTILFMEFWGYFFSISGFLLLVFPKLSDLIVQSTKAIWVRWFGAIIAILIGVIHVREHNIWAWGYEVIITLFGWIALFKGIVLIFFPSVLDVTEKVIQSKYFRIYLVFILCLGLLFLYRTLTW